MNLVSKPVQQLPSAESVTNDDYILIYKDTDGKAYKALATLFRGDDATINGVNALTIEAGDNVTLSQTGETLEISAADTTYEPATASVAGLMSAADKSKLDGVPADATNNVGTITGITMNGVSKGTSGVVNLGTVITAHQDISGKVDKVSGKGLSTNDYTTAEKDKLLSVEAGAQVNEVTLEQYRAVMATLNVIKMQDAGFRKQFEQFRAVFDNFLYAQGVPCYMSAVGTGVIDIMDAAAGQIHSITVDPSLSGQSLYVQLSNGSGLADTTVTVNSNGVASVSLATLKGRNRLYITTSAYTFPPGTNGGHGPHTGGTFVNSHTDENGEWAYDYWIPNHGVEAKVRYAQDTELGDELAREITWEDFLAMCGLSVTYSVTSSPASVQSAGKQLYVKLEGYPFATRDKPIYAKTSYPNASVQVFYVAEYQYL